MKPYLKLETHPLADPKNVVKGDKYRITVLTEHLLRLEYSEDGEFIDAASQTVVNRDFPAVEFSVKDTGDELELRTKYLQLNYNKKAFSANGLSCKTTAVGISSVPAWHYDDRGRLGDPEKERSAGSVLLRLWLEFPPGIKGFLPPLRQNSDASEICTRKLVEPLLALQ